MSETPRTDGTYPMPVNGWQCFHCGEWFKTPGAARDHFGESPTSIVGCIIKGVEEKGLLMALRKAENKLSAVQARLAALLEPGEYGDLLECLSVASQDDGVSEPMQPDEYAALCSEALAAIEQLQAQLRTEHAAHKLAHQQWLTVREQRDQLQAREQEFLHKHRVLMKEADVRLEQAEAKLAECKEDMERLDWLSQQYVTVRTPLRWGSLECFSGSPDEEETTWNLRTAIDASRRKEGT